MNTIRRIHHLIGMLAAGACALLAFAAASPANAQVTRVPIWPILTGVKPVVERPRLHDCARPSL